MARPILRPALVLAMTWLLASAVLTMLLGPQLGARGLFWLGLHDALCLIGCGWEIRRAWRIQLAVRGTFVEE